MIKSSLHLCTKLSEILRSIKDSHVNMLRSAFSCALCALEKACSLCEDKHERIDRDKVIQNISKLLKHWITDSRVIGGSIFGGTVPLYYTHTRTNWKGKAELKVKLHRKLGWKHLLWSFVDLLYSNSQVWQCLLSLELPREYHILTNWHNIVGDLVKERICCMVSLTLLYISQGHYSKDWVRTRNSEITCALYASIRLIVTWSRSWT